MLEERRDQHYLRRRGERGVLRSRKRRGLLRRLLSLAAQALVLVSVCLVGRQIYVFSLTSPIFAVRTIAVRGNHRARTADLLSLSSSFLSQNIFSIDLAKVHEDLLRHPWVLDASIRRSLPDTLEATIEERTPAAIVRFEGSCYLVDATGRRLAEYGPEVADFDFPVLAGLEGLARREVVSRIRAGAAAIGVLSASVPDLARTISYLDLSDEDRIALHPADGSPVLYLDTHDVLRNLENYTEIRKLIPDTLRAHDEGAPTKIAYVDLRFRGRIAVMPQQSGSSAPER